MAPAANIEELLNRLKETMRNGKPTKNEILHKKEIGFVVTLKEQCDSMRTELARLQTDIEYIRRLMSKAQQNKGITCSERRMRALLESSPEGHSELTTSIFNLAVFKETMRMAIHDLMAKSKTADKVDVAKASSGKPVYYTLLKPKMMPLKLNFNSELENAAKLSLWISKDTHDHSPSRRPTRQTHRRGFTHQHSVKAASQPATPRDTASSVMVKQCHTLLDQHSAARKLKSYSAEAKLTEKLDLLLAELEGLQKQRENSSCNSYDFLSYAPLHILLADGDDEPDCPLPVPIRQSPERIPCSSPLVPIKKRMMSANSEDMITLVVCKMLTAIGGQWKELFRKLMSGKFSNDNIDADIKGIIDKPRTEESQAFDALRIWRQAFGRTFHMEFLMSCLEELKRNDIIENICDYEQRLGTGGTDSMCTLCKQSFR